MDPTSWKRISHSIKKMVQLVPFVTLSSTFNHKIRNWLIKSIFQHFKPDLQNRTFWHYSSCIFPYQYGFVWSTKKLVWNFNWSTPRWSGIPSNTKPLQELCHNNLWICLSYSRYRLSKTEKSYTYVQQVKSKERIHYSDRSS